MLNTYRPAFRLLLGCLCFATLTGSATAVAAELVSQVRPGTLPIAWSSGSPQCTRLSPEFQVHAYNEDLFILRESGCVNDEKPFLYLLFGQDKAILFDTGAGSHAVAGRPDVAAVVQRVIAGWLLRNQRRTIPLVVSHLHSHGDHTYGDFQFAGLPNVTLVPPGDVSALQTAFGIGSWPDSIAAYDLGQRVLDIIPIPGHDATSIAVYDRQTGILLTGDTLYPGRIYVNGDPDVFTASVQRLVDFTRGKIVTHVLGTHVEQKAAYADYPVGTTYAPYEAPLALSRGHLLELLDASRDRAADGSIVQRWFRDFSLCGPYPSCNRVNQ
ncbi:MBL fold metallo-hydrolase [Jeongeupia wiesaeckerbachi]|uniref:MBL fold metallo-hydrolase n=1 Tax=Jeongeupia wiesaeckerbachi TaxID=3051218 RepID=UPI003D80115C